jgi:hypothetical protein
LEQRVTVKKQKAAPKWKRLLCLRKAARTLSAQFNFALTYQVAVLQQFNFVNARVFYVFAPIKRYFFAGVVPVILLSDEL